jgi:hypothetical protein
MKYATVVIPFAYTPRWGQIVVASLKEFKNSLDFYIVMTDNSPEGDYIKAVTETSLGEDVNVVVTPPLQRWHAGGLDYMIPFVETPYFFSLETDCTIQMEGWLDWYASFVKDEYVAMVGWFWMLGENIDDGRHYINSSATLYSTRILKILLEECRKNPDTTISYGMNYEYRKFNEHWANIVKEGFAGPFSEQRGFLHENYPYPRPDKWWQEPGNWLFNRVSCQWECVRVPGAMVPRDEPHSPDVKYNYYGDSYEEAYVLHYWGGTVSHNFDKHEVSTAWEIDCLEWWLRREYRSFLSTNSHQKKENNHAKIS